MEMKVGHIGWMDLTVQDAEGVRDFYKAVVGWDSTEQNVGDYNDFNMHKPDDESPVAGICHQKGDNADIPAHWMIYITVADLDASIAAAEANGGKVMKVQKMDEGGIAILLDPAGAVFALWQA